MLSRLLFYLLLTVSQSVYSQKILVPYRVGNMFGLADTAGNMVLVPGYDHITVKKRTPNGYFIADKAGKTTLLYENKEIIANSDYSEFEVFRNKFISAFRTGLSYDFEPTLKNSAADQQERSYQSLFSINGVNIYPANFKNFNIIDTLEWSLKNRKQSRYAIFVAKNMENKCSLFTFDCDEQQISQWICTDYYRIGLTGRINGRRVLMVQQNKWDDEKEFTLAFVKGKFILEPALKKSKGSSGSPNNDGVDMPYGKRMSGLTVPSNSGDQIQAKFKWVNNEIQFIRTPDMENENQFAKIVLPVIPDTMEIINYYNVVTNRAHKQIVLLNFVRYKMGNKYGLVFTDSISTKPLYDSVLHLSYSRGEEEEHCFLVGIKDNETGRLKFGTIDAYGKEVIPVMYESIDFGSFDKNSLSQTIYYKKWIIKKDGLYGFISSKGQLLLENKYDTIYENKLRFQHFSDRFLVIKKGDKYGALINWYSDKPTICEAFSIKKIGYYIEDYQGINGLLLLGLLNNDNSSFCFAKTNGFLFYKE